MLGGKLSRSSLVVSVYREANGKMLFFSLKKKSNHEHLSRVTCKNSEHLQLRASKPSRGSGPQHSTKNALGSGFGAVRLRLGHEAEGKGSARMEQVGQNCFSCPVLPRCFLPRNSSGLGPERGSHPSRFPCRRHVHRARVSQQPHARR